MNAIIRNSLLVAGLVVSAASARAQFTIDWYTIDNGGGHNTGGTFEVTGTIGQADAVDVVSGGTFEVRGGFWTSASAPCYANCDQSTTAPILNINDFQCFLNSFAAAQSLPPNQQATSYANCDQSTTQPILNVNDFQCFVNKFAVGCS
jgi:hypothetical protein